MSYTAKTWKTGETITATDLNALEAQAQQNADDISTIQSALPTYVGSSVTKLAATTYTPTTSNQTIASGQYLSGTQTIKGDSNLTASNIKSGTSIFGVTGTYTGSSSSSSTVSLQSKTATPSESSQTITADSGYDGLSSVTVSAISTTYIGSGVTKKAAATYTPGTSSQTIASGQYLSGTQTISGDTNLKAANIKSGTSIFGVTGTYTGSSSSSDTGIDTSDATAAAENIESGYTAYVDGSLVTGSITNTSTSIYYLVPFQPTAAGAKMSCVALQYSSDSTKRIVGDGTYMNLCANLDEFGDATASDVASGKTFTSKAGLLVTGTGSSSGSGTNNMEGHEVDATDLTVTFSGSGSTIKVWGYAVGSSTSAYSTTRYAFYGSYYVTISLTSATESALSITIDDDGAISGLPTMTSGTLLVTMED